MEERKSLKDISWNISEPEYRNNSALSYSTISRFDKEGFENLDNLFTQITTPSLLLGQIVDTIITDGEDEFNNRFVVAEYPDIPAYETYDELLGAIKKVIGK